MAAIICLCILTVVLRGAAPEKTYLDSEISASSVRVTTVFYRQDIQGNWSVSTRSVEGHTPALLNEGPFQALVLQLPSQYEPTGAWSIRWVSVKYTLTSDSEVQYEMFLLSGNATGIPLVEAQGPILLSHSEAFTDIYRLDITPKHQLQQSKELMLLEPFLDDLSILIASKNLEAGGFSSFKLHSIELMSSNVVVGSASSRTLEELTLDAVIAIVAVPALLLAVLAFQVERPSDRPQRIFLWALLAYGVVARLVVAPFTGHPYDMEVWTQSTRLYYESGLIDVRCFPLPFTYYVLLVAYSPYALMRLLGFQDPTFLSHIPGMVESVFIKAPFMVADILVLYLMIEIIRNVEGVRSDPVRPMAFGLMYFLNPLAIYLSGAWGMYESIAVALFFAGIYLGLSRGRTLPSTLSFVMSGLTKGFGFLGLVLLLTIPTKERRAFKILGIAGIALGVSCLLYLPLLAASTIADIPEVISQFLRGRAGLGSNTPIVAGASYMSYLSVLGFDIVPPLLTYIFVGVLLIISIVYARSLRASAGRLTLELTLRYFAVSFLVFYLVFFRVYEQYYLWVIPILILYSYVKRASAPGFVAMTLGITLACSQLGTIIAGAAYYYGIPLNLPFDMSILTLLASTMVVCGLITVASMKGRLAIFESDRVMAALEGPALWFSVTLAFYARYKTPILGMAWYPISFAIALTGGAFLYWKLGLPWPRRLRRK
jgi:hypothetical protein